MAYDNGRYVLDLKMEDGSKKRYVMAVFRIISKREDGTPQECDMVMPNDKVILEGNEEFMTAFIPMEMVGNGGGG